MSSQVRQVESFAPSFKLAIAPMIRQDVSSPYTNIHLPLPTLRPPAEALITPEENPLSADEAARSWTLD
jgi:hypothetical protein